jgi:integrase
MDVTINGLRYRESLKTSDKREAATLEKKRIAEIEQGKGSSKSGRQFARLPFEQAATEYIEGRNLHISTRTHQLDRERMKPLLKFFEKPLLRIRVEDIASYQRKRLEDNVSGRTVNMEIGVLRGMMKKAKVWNMIAEDVRMFPEDQKPIGKVLVAEQKQKLLETAASRDSWMVAYNAAVLAANTTCRGVELKHLRWTNVEFENREIHICRSKNETGHRRIPLNNEALQALLRLWGRAQIIGSTALEHHVFPSCEKGNIDPTRPQKSWRTAWRNLTEKAGLKGFRFHDLRHQAITELAETGISDQTLMSIAGHMSRRMLEHYSHIRMKAKREAVDALNRPPARPLQPAATHVQ